MKSNTDVRQKHRRTGSARLLVRPLQGGWRKVRSTWSLGVSHHSGADVNQLPCCLPLGVDHHRQQK